jgi:hypothetical protein
MKQFNNYILISLIFFSNLYAYDLSDWVDTNISGQKNKKLRLYTPKKKVSKTTYDKFKDIFSDYKGPWIEDMFTYSFDILIPDEIMLATEDVKDNRDGNDAYSIMLTTAYYHFQDISRITEDQWEEDACDPGTFTYDISKEPKEPLLHLKANDKNARGVTKNGVVLPINDNFSDAYYPYASEPDGCSAEGLQDVYDLANDFSDDEPWLSKACDNHDRCYFTEGTSSKECNAQFIIEAIDSCNHISNKDTLLFMGMPNAFCGFKALTVSSAANACADKYFAQAQKKQKAYNQWIMRYEEAYFKAKQKNQ